MRIVITKAIAESKAIKVYISNIMTEIGQTDEYTVSDHIRAIKEHCRQDIIDYCIYDTGEVVPEYIKKYNMQGQDLVRPDISNVKGVQCIQKNLSSIVQNEFARHDPELVASAIIELVCDDLKYQDKQSDPKYLMLNNMLREEKRINKSNKNPRKKAKKAIGGKKKFSDKYEKRIKSIKDSGKKQAKKKKDAKKGNFAKNKEDLFKK